MPWDPASLQIEKVRCDSPITDAQTSVEIVIDGQGFGLGDEMRGVLVRAGQPHTRQNTIPCNDIKVTEGDYQATARICPKGKGVGAYDLIWWLLPPDEVEDGQGKSQSGVPVNDVAVYPGAIRVDAAE